jgi:hypothetical protein
LDSGGDLQAEGLQAGDLIESGGASAEKIYDIADYYNEDGAFSALGLELGFGLDEKDTGRAMTVSGGDVIIAGGRKYVVAVESLTLSFYTQPSPDQVVQWWIDYLDSWAESGHLTAVN